MRFPFLPLCLGALAAAAGSAASATVATTSADCLQTPRSISVLTQTAATCLAAGRGSLRGTDDAFRAAHGPWVQLDTSDPAGRSTKTGWLSDQLNGVEGSFMIDAAAFAAYDHIAIGFQTGGSRGDPDWVAFELAGATLAGKWAISAQNVGHVVLYGMNEPPLAIGDLPEPASLALAGVALAGLGLTRRQRRPL